MGELTKEERDRLAEIEDFKFVVSDKRGRRFVRRLLENAGVFRLSFNATNESSTAFNEGARNQGLALLNEITEVAPEHLTEIMTGEE